MAVSGEAAIQTMTAARTWRPGYCLEAVWQAYKRNGARTSQAAPTAFSGWEGSGGKHHGDRNPPRGVPVWFGKKPSSAAGDVVISLGGGYVLATDWPRNGVIGVCTIDQRQRQISRPYLGWTENILGYPIDFGQSAAGTASTAAVQAPAPIEEEEMSGPLFITPNVVAFPNGYTTSLPDNAWGALKARFENPDSAGMNWATQWAVDLSWQAADFMVERQAKATAAAVRAVLESGGIQVDVDEEQIGRTVADALGSRPAKVEFDDETLELMAKKNADEEDRRDRERLTIGTEPSA
jgi:hypothetical protein